MQKVVLVSLLALGFAWNCHAQSWTFVQEALDSYCVPGQSSCSFSSGTLAPTTAGTVRVIFLRTANASNAPNSVITSVTGAGSTWNLCPASSCHIQGNDDLDMAYAIGGSGGQTNITVNVSPASGTAFFTLYLYEFLPPAGFTASFDASGTANHSCTAGSTTGVTLATTATDLILTGRGNGDPVPPFAYSAPYIHLPSNNGLAINDTTGGAAPTVACTGSTLIWNAIAFKSTAGTFTPPPAHMKAVNYTNNNNNAVNCGTSCSFTIPSTTSGNLLYVQTATTGGAFLQSVSAGGTSLVVPSSCQVGMAAQPNNSAGYLSCAYVLSAPGGVTSLSVTMTTSGAVQFAVMEVKPLNGTFALDTIGSTFNSTGSPQPPGQSLTLTGSDDVIFQAAFIPGGTTAYTYYPMPPSSPKTQSMFFNNQAAFVAVLDAPYGAFPSNAAMTWCSQDLTVKTIVTGAAFKTTSGTATAPNPPSGLTAVVN